MTATTDIDSAELLRHVERALDDVKALDVRVLNVRKLTVITDYMVIASGRSARQVKALTDRVREEAVKHGAVVVGVEGDTQADWVLVDLGDVVVHIMQPATRDFYQLEKLWEEPSQTRADAG